MTYQITEESFEQLWPAWEALLPQGNFQTVFLTPSWHHVWWREHGGGSELRLNAVRDGEALVGIAPLMSTGNVLLFLGDTDLWDYHDFIVTQGREADFYPALLDHLDAQPWDLLDLRSIPEFSPTMAHLPPLAEARGYTVEVAEEDVSPGVALPNTWDDYLMSLSKKDRHELRRKFRRLDNRADYRSYSVDDSSSIDSALDDFFELMRISHQDKAIFLSPERERFFRRITEEVARIGALKLFFMEVSGKRVAGALCFDYGNARLLYNSGYDPDYSSLSIGLLLKAQCLKEAIEEGKGYFDFLRGKEPYKYHFGASDVQLYHLMVRRALHAQVPHSAVGNARGPLPEPAHRIG